MNNQLQAVDGRQSLAFILEPTAGAAVSTALAVGDIVIVKSKATSNSIFGTAPVNSFFIANKALTPGSGDTYIKCTPYFCGQAKDKSYNSSKNTTDITVDWDEKQNYQTDGIISTSGSISGANMMMSIGTENALSIIKSRFTTITEIGSEGTAQVKEAKTTEKDILMIIWNGRDAKVDDYLDIDIIPVLFTSLNKGGSYGSSQTFDVDYQGNSCDENGYMGGAFQIQNVAGLIPSFARPSV